jgi:hypothetical protein
MANAYPIYAPFGSFQYVNWTVTFFLEALLRAKQVSPKAQERL